MSRALQYYSSKFPPEVLLFDKKVFHSVFNEVENARVLKADSKESVHESNDNGKGNFRLRQSENGNKRAYAYDGKVFQPP